MGTLTQKSPDMAGAQGERKAPAGSLSRNDLAEGVGFEPTVTTGATTVFETAPIGRSGTLPDSWIITRGPLAGNTI